MSTNRGYVRRRRRKQNTSVSIIAVTATVLAVAVVMYCFVFRVKNVRIAGSSSLPLEEVVRQTGIERGSSIFSLEEEAVRRSVESGGLLLFDGIQVQMPSTVTVAIHERERAVMLLSAGTLLVLDPDLWVLSQEAEIPDESLLYVTGLDVAGYKIGQQISAPEGQIAVVSEIYRALLEAEALSLVSELEVDNLNDIHIWSRTGIYVIVGDSENLANKMKWMAATLRDLEARGETSGRLDVTSGNKADYQPN